MPTEAESDEAGVIASAEWRSLVWASAICAGLGRALLEYIFILRPNGEQFGLLAVVDFCAYYLAFTASASFVLERMCAVPTRIVAMVCAAGCSVALLPPLVDTFVHGIGKYRYLYLSELNWAKISSFSPDGFPVGEAIGLSLVVAGMMGAAALFAPARIRSLAVAAVMSAGAVAAHVWAIPSLARGCERQLGSLGATGTITFLHAIHFALFHLALSKGAGTYLLKRLPHMAPWVATPLLGCVVSGAVQRLAGWAAIAFGFTFLSLIVENDVHDRQEDEANSLFRPFGATEATALRIAFVLAALASFGEPDATALLLILFWVLGLAYSIPPSRLKLRPFPSMYLVEATWGGLAYLSGALKSDAGPMRILVGTVVVSGGFFMVSPLKDLKDLAGDQAAGVPSLPSLLVTRGVPERHARTLIGIVASLTMLVGVFLTSGRLSLTETGLLTALALMPSAACAGVRSGEWATRISLIAVSAGMFGAVVFLG